jgi:putative RNA 2'-phosphotransferase
MTDGDPRQASGVDLVADSRVILYVLRHDPSALGLTLDSAGWVSVETLLTALTNHGRRIDRQRLARLVTGLDKPRLEVNGERIRASHGHSIEVDLGLEPAIPPNTLFHGTMARNLARIRTEGLKPMNRRHVHLSPDMETARKVAARRGTPVILSIDAATMHTNGHIFLPTNHQVWLTATVPPHYLTPLPD